MIRSILCVGLLVTLVASVWLLGRSQAQPARVYAPMIPPRPAEPVPTTPIDNGTDFNRVLPVPTGESSLLLHLGELFEDRARLTDPATKERLQKLLGELFDLRHQMQQQELQMLEDRLRILRDQLEGRSKQREAILARQLEAILQGKEPGIVGWKPEVPAHLVTGTSNAPGAVVGRPATPGTTMAPLGSAGSLLPSSTTPNAGANSLFGSKPATIDGISAPIDIIRVGLPEELLGQLLQAKTDRDRALIVSVIDSRMNLLKAQLTEQEARLARLLRLQETKAVDTETIEQARSRLAQLKVLFQAHSDLRGQAGH